MTRELTNCLAALAVMFGAGVASAQDYPSRFITMIVPAAPGGTTDAVGRLLAKGMGDALNQQIIVENVGGAGATIGTAKAARSPNDGYTIFFQNLGLSTGPALYEKLAYDPIADFEPIGLVADFPMIIAGRKNYPAQNIGEVLRDVKGSGGKINWASAGVGTTTHLCALLFQNTLGTNVTMVSYKGAGPAIMDLIADRVDFLCDMAPSVLPQVNSGNLKAYAVTSKGRMAPLPQTPTLDEAGMQGFDLVVWHGLWVPKGTPKHVIDKLAVALRTALADPALRAKLAEFGAEPVSPERAQPEALRAYLKSEVAKWSAVIAKAGVPKN